MPTSPSSCRRRTRSCITGWASTSAASPSTRSRSCITSKQRKTGTDLRPGFRPRKEHICRPLQKFWRRSWEPLLSMCRTSSTCWMGETPFPSSPATARSFTAAMDDTALRKLEDRLTYLRNLDQRRQEVKSAIEGQEQADAGAGRRHRQQPRRWRRWRTCTAPISKSAAPVPPSPVKRGWRRWRSCCWPSGGTAPTPCRRPQGFIDPEKGVETVADALQGANDIVAGASVGRRRHPQDPAGAAACVRGSCGVSAAEGGGLRLPPVLRL